MRSEVYSVALSGLTATIVKITVTLEPGEPSLRFVGVDDLEVRHLLNVWASALGRARRRIEDNRIVIEFSPPVGRDIDKLSLALFVALHLASENRSLPDTLVLGDILPSGWLRPVCGALPALLGIRGMARAIVPEENGPETACVPGMEVFAAETLLDVLAFVRGEHTLPSAGTVLRAHWPRYDMVDLRLLREGSRAAEIVAAVRDDEP
jgi:magnesium chelatase family protein